MINDILSSASLSLSYFKSFSSTVVPFHLTHIYQMTQTTVLSGNHMQKKTSESQRAEKNSASNKVVQHNLSRRSAPVVFVRFLPSPADCVCGWSDENNFIFQLFTSPTLISFHSLSPSLSRFGGVTERKVKLILIKSQKCLPHFSFSLTHSLSTLIGFS